MGEGREMFFMGGWGGGNIFWVSGCGWTFFMVAWVVGGGGGGGAGGGGGGGGGSIFVVGWDI